MVDLGAGIDAQVLFAQRMAKVFLEPLRIKILVELNMRAMSAKQFFDEFGGGSLTRVWRQFKVLEESDWIEKVGEKSGGKRRGATEHFYRATQLAIFDSGMWTPLPASMKGMVSAMIFETLRERVAAAMEAGTFDARVDRHFTWTALRLDQAGWINMIAATDDLFRLGLTEQTRAERNLAESGEEPIPMTLALACFESPEDTTKAP